MARPLGRDWIIHSVRTTIAAVGSLLGARVLRLPEAYWAVITAMIVMQSTLGAALTISWQRLAGTALGATVAALLVVYVGPSVIAFAVGVLVLGLLCAALRLDRSGYRFASITLTIVMLIDTKSAWLIAMDRFLEVSFGIGIGLVVTAAWPEKRTASPASRRQEL
jgi:uncharacterized membrane protein YgaE (UPF0421/DUF939 family)